MIVSFRIRPFKTIATGNRADFPEAIHVLLAKTIAPRHGPPRPAVPIQQSRNQRRGFSLVEILLVVVIIAILAAVVLPAITDATTASKDATLVQNLRVIRTQIERFKLDHGGHPPGWNGASVALHLHNYSNASGQSSLFPNQAYPFGPYLPQRFVVNPFNDGSDFMIVANPSEQTADHSLIGSSSQPVGWFYDPATGQIAPNAEGTNADGIQRVKL